jgi:hypothetical protein
MIKCEVHFHHYEEEAVALEEKHEVSGLYLCGECVERYNKLKPFMDLTFSDVIVKVEDITGNEIFNFDIDGFEVNNNDSFKYLQSFDVKIKTSRNYDKSPLSINFSWEEVKQAKEITEGDLGGVMVVKEFGNIKFLARKW